MRRKLAIALFLILVFSIIAIVFKKESIGQKSTETESEFTASDNDKLSLPIPQRSDSVLNTWIAYVFRAPIKELNKRDENRPNYTLILETENKTIPPLFLSERVAVFKVVDEQQINMSIDELQKGTVVDVFASYNIDNNSWSVGRIIIPPEEVPQNIQD